jgi:hypothetical protein
MIGQSHVYKRNGIMNLFAALNVGTRGVTGWHYKRRRRLEFLMGGSFGRVPELIAHIDGFIANYNEVARPFAWTKSVVHQKRMRPYFAVSRFRVLAEMGTICTP